MTDGLAMHAPSTTEERRPLITIRSPTFAYLIVPFYADLITSMTIGQGQGQGAVPDGSEADVAVTIR